MSFVRHMTARSRPDEPVNPELLDLLRVLHHIPEPDAALAGEVRRSMGPRKGSACLDALSRFCGALRCGARRRTRLGPRGSGTVTQDELGLLALLGALQNGRDDEAAIRCATLFKPFWHKRAREAALDAAISLRLAGLRLPASDCRAPEFPWQSRTRDHDAPDAPADPSSVAVDGLHLKRESGTPS